MLQLTTPLNAFQKKTKSLVNVLLLNKNPRVRNTNKTATRPTTGPKLVYIDC